MSLEIRLSRPDRTYRAGEKVSGVVVLNSASPVSHTGLTLQASGIVRPQLESKAGLFDGFYSSIKPIEVLSTVIDMAAPGKLPGGVPLPFEFPVEAIPGRRLTETYHGVYVSVKYSVRAELARTGWGAGKLDAGVEFVVEVPVSERPPPAPLDFDIKPESLSNVKKTAVAQIPRFSIRGHLNKTNCSLSSAFTGELTVTDSEAKIRSIELQLVRVETIQHGEQSSKESTEIQNLQIGEGEVCRGLSIPLYMIFPRIFTCPTSIGDSFRVEFEVNIIVVFEDHYMITENFPISLYRDVRASVI